jgi:hypothetical protein
MLYFHHRDPYFDDDSHPPVLDEMQFTDLMHAIGEPRDLPYQDYAPLVKYVRYIGTKFSIMKFIVPSRTSLNEWPCYIQWTQWGEQVRDSSITAPEAARLLLWSGDLRIHCGCPAYLFWGMQYIDTQLDIAIRPEIRYPGIRNPDLKGIACKHLIRTLKVLPFHLGDMAKAIKQQRS